WATMLAGDAQSAKTYAARLTQPAQELGPRDPTPAVSRVLSTWIDYTIKPAAPETRAALTAAFTARAAAPGPGLISVRAAEALVRDTLAQGRWQEASAAASTGATIVTGFGGDLNDSGFQFELNSLTSSFIDKPTVPTAMRMRDLAERTLNAGLAAKDA